MMGGAQSGSSPAGGGGGVYLPQAQPAADQMYQDIVSNLNAQGYGPAGLNYPTGQNFVDNYVTGSPYITQAMAGAETAAREAGGFYPYQSGAGYSLLGGGNTALPYGNVALQQAFSPLYQQLVDYTQQNPYFSTALSGANQAAAIGGQGATNLQGPVYSTLPAAADLLNAGPSALDKANMVWGNAGAVADTAFDPRSALFSRTQGRVMDQQNAVNAMSGVAGTPYGAGLTGDALRNFDIDWQNQQLTRQGAGLGALNTGAGAYNAGLGAYGGALGNYDTAVGSALQNLGGIANLGATTAALPASTYQNQLGNIANMLKGQQTGAAVGSNAFADLLNSAGGAYSRGAGLQNTALQQYLAGTQQPYNTGVGLANNALSGLSNVTNLGAQQYALPESVLNNLAAYMRLGQAASGISGQLGNLGFNQTAQGLGGLLGGANMLLGNNSLLGGSSGIFGAGGALGGLGGLFGGSSIPLDMAGVAQTAGGLGAATGLDAGTLAMIGLI